MNANATSSLSTALAFLDRLDSAGLTYRLERVRDALMVGLAIPGERWEIEFFDDGNVEVERFRSTGEIEDAGALEFLFDTSDRVN